METEYRVGFPYGTTFQEKVSFIFTAGKMDGVEVRQDEGAVYVSVPERTKALFEALVESARVRLTVVLNQRRRPASLLDYAPELHSHFVDYETFMGLGIKPEPGYEIQLALENHPDVGRGTPVLLQAMREDGFKVRSRIVRGYTIIEMEV